MDPDSTAAAPETTQTVTLAVMAFNRERLIGRSIESALSQTRSPDEILVVDGGSKDRTPEVAESFPGVRVIRHSERLPYLAQTRNAALRAAKGDILIFLDDDAVIAPNCVAALLAQHEQGADGVAAQVFEGNVGSPWDEWRRRYAWSRYDRVTRLDWLYGMCCSYRRAALEAVGGFAIVGGEDLDMGMRLTRAGYRLVVAPEAVVYHQRQDSLRSLLRQMYIWEYWGAVALFRYANDEWYRRLRWRHLGATTLTLGGATLKRSVCDFASGRGRLGIAHWLVWGQRIRAVVNAIKDVPRYRTRAGGTGCPE